MGALLLGVSLSVAAAVRQWVLLRGLRTRGILVEGVVTKRQKSHYLRAWHYRVRYRYSSGDGVTFAGNKLVPGDMYDMVRVRKPVDVLYLPDHPRISNLPGNTMPLTQAIIWAVAWVFALVMVLVMIVVAQLQMG